MKNWLIPIAVLGVSGVGLLCVTDRGREQMRSIFDHLMEHGDPWGDFSKFLDDQLATMQRTLDSLAQALEDSKA